MQIFWSPIRMLSILSIGLFPMFSSASPSFDCNAVKESSIEKLICGNEELSALDLKLSNTYSEAVKRIDGKTLSSLKAMQRGWIKGRNDCWKSEDQKQCIADSYINRIAELQAEYELVKPSGPFVYLCPDSTSNRIEVFYFPTDPLTAKAKRGDQTSFMYAQPTGSGARYQGPNESLWEHQGEARVSWGYGSKEMICKLEVLPPKSH
ncbi:MAG TPA: MliC family protein [Cellvibrio sp.]|nr:MliC family protein [Cellvibrio sp.]